MALSANLLEVQEMLRNISMQEVQQVASGQSGKANQILGMDELKRRAEMQSEAQGADAEAQQGQPPMIDQYLQMSQQAMGQGPPPPPPPQGMPQGMPQMPQMPQGPPPSQQGIGSMMPPPPRRQMPQGMPPGMGQGMPPGMGQGMPQGPPPQMGMAGGGSVRGYAGPDGSYVQSILRGGSVGPDNSGTAVGPYRLTDMSRADSNMDFMQNLTPEKEEIVRKLVRQALARGVPPELAVSVALQETNRFDSTAESSAGAQGLMQIKPGAFGDMQKRLGREEIPLEQRANILNPDDNIEAGVEYLKLIQERDLKESGGNPDDIDAFRRQSIMYNRGPWHDLRDNLPGLQEGGDRTKEAFGYGQNVPYMAEAMRETGVLDQYLPGPVRFGGGEKAGQASNNPLADLGSEQLSAMYRDGDRTEGGGLLGRFIPNWGSQTEAGLKQQQDIANELSRRSGEGNLTDRELYDLRSEVLLGDANRTDGQFDSDQKRRAAASAVSDTREGIVKNIERNAATLSGPQKPVPWEGGAIEFDRSTVFAAPGSEQSVDMTDELMDQIVKAGGDPIRVIGDTPPEGAGFMESLKDGKYKSLFDFMMMSGLQYASGSNIGEAGVAGLGYLGEQQTMDNEAGRRALQDRASQATIALSEEKTRRLKAGMSMTELRQEAIKVLGKNSEFLMETDAAKKEIMVQEMVAMMSGTGSGGTNRIMVGQGGREV